jgi:hypothetical protein
MNIKKILIILAHAFVGWALCGATMWIGMAAMSLQNAQIAHAIGAPIYFALVSLVYFRRFNYTTPLQTAIIFVSFVIAVDFFLVALVINKSLEMFASPLGTWIPFALIFISTYLTGLYVQNSQRQKAVVQ